jgi:hypothetical protein
LPVLVDEFEEAPVRLLVEPFRYLSVAVSIGLTTGTLSAFEGFSVPCPTAEELFVVEVLAGLPALDGACALKPSEITVSKPINIIFITLF